MAGQLKVLLQRKKQEDYLRSLPAPRQYKDQADYEQRDPDAVAWITKQREPKLRTVSQVPAADAWKSGLGPKVRETKKVQYKIGVGDAHNPVLDITASSDEDAVAQAKKLMKKKLNAGEVREPKMGWIFHILSRS